MKSQSKRRQKMAVSLTSLHSFTASTAFRVLVALLGLVVLTSIWIFLQLDVNMLHVSTPGSPLRHQQQESQIPPPPHIFPRLPYLPAFPSLGDNPEEIQKLIDETLHANKPTIAGIASILYAFLQDLHASHKHIADSERQAYNFDDIRASYVRLVQKHLVPLDAAYRDRPIFPIRNDDSVFVSVAAFREHLLADTLASMFTSAAHPEKLFVGVVVINCFGFEGEYPCQGSAKVVGKDKNGRDVLDIQDGRPDINHIETFCQNATFQQYCEGGHVRVLYVNETDALGPAVTRYFTSKLWGGETHYVQVDSHLRFANRWDELYIADLKLTTSYPKSVLSTYPPGFVNFRQEPPFTPGTRLCRCQIRPEEEFLPRVEMEGRCREDEVRPTQMAFIGAGFFFARAEFIVDVPFDPILMHLFMGEEVALSVRAWTHGWNIFAPRKNLIGHQYRPIKMHTPHYWTSVGKFFNRPQLTDRVASKIKSRIKYMMGYPDFSLQSIQQNNIGHENDEAYNVLLDLEYYGLGKSRTREEYLKFAEIDLEMKTCGPMKWCSEGQLE